MAKTVFETINIKVDSTEWIEAHKKLRDEFNLKFFSWLSAVDWDNDVSVGEAPKESVSPCFEVITCLSDLANTNLIVVSTSIGKSDPKIDSLIEVYAGANWHEREAHEMFGTMDLADLVNPTIELLKEGVPVTDDLYWAINDTESLKNDPESKKIYLADEVIRGGKLFIEDLIKTMELIRDFGKAGFYDGENAERIEKAMIEMWQRRMEFQFLNPMIDIFRNTHEMWKDRIVQIPQVAEIASEGVKEQMVWLDQELEGKEYIAGGGYSVADITAQCAFVMCKAAVGIRIPEDLSNLDAWWSRVTSRPTARA